MAEPFDPIEIDDLDESLLADMTPEAMAAFREKMLAALDEMETFEPDIDKEEEEYYEWEDRINIIHDLIVMRLTRSWKTENYNETKGARDLLTDAVFVWAHTAWSNSSLSPPSWRSIQASSCFFGISTRFPMRRVGKSARWIRL